MTLWDDIQSHPIASASCAATCLCCCLGWIGFVLGPGNLALAGAIGFVGGITAFVMAARQCDGCGHEHSRLLGQILMVILLILIPTIALSFVVTVACGQGAGNASIPVMAERQSYELNNRGRITLVSRERYLRTGIGLATTLAAIGLSISIAAFGMRLYSKPQP